MSTTGTGDHGLVERLTAFLDGHDSLESRGDVVDRIVVSSGTHVLSARDLRQLLTARAGQPAVDSTPEASATEREERLRGIRQRVAHLTPKPGEWSSDGLYVNDAGWLLREVARLDAVVTAVREEHELVWVPNGISGDSDLVCGCGWIAEDEDDHCPTRRTVDKVAS